MKVCIATTHFHTSVGLGNLWVVKLWYTLMHCLVFHSLSLILESGSKRPHYLMNYYYEDIATHIVGSRVTNRGIIPSPSPVVMCLVSSLQLSAHAHWKKRPPLAIIQHTKLRKSTNFCYTYFCFIIFKFCFLCCATNYCKEWIYYFIFVFTLNNEN